MSEVSVVHWNPRGNLVAGRLPVRSRVNNFGDLIGPLLVSLITRRDLRALRVRRRSQRLLTVGSILHLAVDGDTVWGAGARGDTPDADYSFRRLDIRAVRGPHTRELLRGRGVDAPAVYGDPALLLPDFLPRLREWAERKTREVTVVPNFADLGGAAQRDDRWLDPRSGLTDCLRAIAQSEAVVGSSLHGIVLADSLGIPARLVASGHESAFKYADYYAGTRRRPAEPAPSVNMAIRELPGRAEVINADPALLRAFPHDLWTR